MKPDPLSLCTGALADEVSLSGEVTAKFLGPRHLMNQLLSHQQAHARAVLRRWDYILTSYDRAAH